mgnify:CR=1 FL=1
MSPFEYRRQEQQGCGGCLLFAILLILLSVGDPLLFKFLGVILKAALFLALAGLAALWVSSGSFLAAERFSKARSPSVSRD